MDWGHLLNLLIKVIHLKKKKVITCLGVSLKCFCFLTSYDVIGLISGKRTIYIGLEDNLWKIHCSLCCSFIDLYDWFIFKEALLNLSVHYSPAKSKEKIWGPHLNRVYNIWQHANEWKNLIPASYVTMTPKDTVWVVSPQGQQSLWEHLGSIWLRSFEE